MILNLVLLLLMKMVVNHQMKLLTINEITPVELLVNGSETTTICLGETISLDATDGLVYYNWVSCSGNW